MSEAMGLNDCKKLNHFEVLEMFSPYMKSCMCENTRERQGS